MGQGLQVVGRVVDVTNVPTRNGGAMRRVEVKASPTRGTLVLMENSQNGEPFLPLVFGDRVSAVITEVSVYRLSAQFWVRDLRKGDVPFDDEPEL